MTNFEQSVPETEMLYLDKAWSGLQQLTAPTSLDVMPRPAHRMFEGQVTPHEWGWLPWVRAIMPEEVSSIATDLANLVQEASDEKLKPDVDEPVWDYLKRAAQYAAQLAGDNRGFVYMIG